MMLKRLFDIIASFLGLIILWPLGIIIAILVKVTSPGPVFFIQKRVGKDGELFDCVKFRTMTVDAEKKGTVTTASDRRITKIGQFLRRWKLDEFPQLWNVFIGKMSFVGPRPDVAGYADKLNGDDQVVLKLRPGITGPATLYFRHEEYLLTKVEDPVKFNDSVIWPLKVRINRDYYINWSFWKDIGFIFVTIFPGLNTMLRIVQPPPRSPEECLLQLSKK